MSLRPRWLRASFAIAPFLAAISTAEAAPRPRAPQSCGVTPAAAGTDTITVTFDNLNPPNGPMGASNTWVTFCGATTGLAGTINGSGHAIVLGQSYPMLTLSQGVTLKYFNSGRICISYGAGLTANAGNCWSPNFANAGLPDFTTRWDKVELTWSGLSGGANLTSQDFFGIPMQLKATGGGQPASTLTWWTATATAMNALGAMCGYSLDTVATPQGSLVTGMPGVTLSGLPGQSVIRVINPATVTAASDGTTGYPSFQPYWLSLYNGGTPVAADISGNNGAYAGSTQTYSFAVALAAQNKVVGSGTVHKWDLLFDGSVCSGGTNSPTAFVIRSADLTDTNVYGANAPYTMLKGSNVNAIVEKARADYLSALNFGLVNSSETNPMRPTKTVGASPSWTWYGNPPNGINQSAMPITAAFAAAQPTHAYYNPFAGYLTTVTDAYGFAFNDRLQAPLASLGPGSTVAITVLTDAGGTGAQSSLRGPMDLVLQHSATGELDAWNLDEWDVNGSYEPMAAIGPGSRVCAVADWNGDGQRDLLWHWWGFGRLVLSEFANGQEYARTTLNVAPRGPAWLPLGAGDMDNDGNCDIAWGRLTDSMVEVWQMRGGNRVAAFTPTGQAWRAVGGQPLAVTDWNSDGRADLVVWDSMADTVTAYRLLSGRFSPIVTVDLPPQAAGPNWQPVAFDDFDSDGDHDIVLQKRNTGALRALVLDAAGGVEQLLALPSPSGAAWVVRNSR